LFGAARDEGSGATSGNGSKNGSGGSVSGAGGAASGGAETTGDGGATPTDTGGAPGVTSNGGVTSTAGASASGGVASGGVPTASGGVGSGGKSSSEAGRTGDGGSTGSGGAEMDSGTGSGGAQDSGSSTGGAPSDHRVRCGSTTCDLTAGESCCVREVPMGMGMVRTVAACSKDVMNCVNVFRCDSDADCAHGEHCCLDFTSSPTVPSSSCSARACDAPLACSVPDDCPSGQTCCGTIGTVQMVGVKYTSVTCQDQCKPSTPATAFCINDAPCAGNETCQQSATLPPGYTVCRAGP
jgi:hypothetical protein